MHPVAVQLHRQLQLLSVSLIQKLMFGTQNFKHWFVILVVKNSLWFMVCLWLVLGD